MCQAAGTRPHLWDKGMRPEVLHPGMWPREEHQDVSSAWPTQGGG